MKKILLLLVVIVILPLQSYALIEKIGGNFKGAPEEMNAHISEGAKALIAKAFIDIPEDGLRDHHTHVVGLDAKQGTSVNPKMLSWRHPIHRIKTSAYLSGAMVDDLAKANEQYNDRLIRLIRAIPNHGKFHILAFDHHYNKDGSINEEKSEFYTSNEYVFKLAEQYPDLFVPVISVHPYRKNALEELEKWAKQGAKWVKWLPNAHGINASDASIEPYYELMKQYDMTLLTHVGEEQAVEADEDQALGNPLLFRKPLDMGVRVVMAHCASLGEDADFDNGNKKASSFELFLRMMDNPKYDGLLFGEISAMTQFNRLPTPLLTLLKRKDLHHRLVNGSDYPLPAINIIIQTKKLVKYDMITEQEREYLNDIYSYNPMLFDYVLKRTIKHPETKESFSPDVFVGLDNSIRDKNELNKKNQIPSSVLDYILSEEKDCRINELESLPMKSEPEKFIQRADLNEDGITDYMFFSSNIYCEAGASMRTGNSGIGGVIFVGAEDNNAFLAFSETVYDMQIKNENGVSLVLVRVGGKLCGQKNIEIRAEEASCERTLIWNGDSKKFEIKFLP